MRNKEIREQLLEFLDRHAFNPILEAMPDQYSSERDRSMLYEVKRIAAMEKERFYKNSQTAVEIRDQYFKELIMETSGKTGRELEDLELPRLLQLREKFVQLCRELNIN